ncbi:MAG: hypothetical protein HGA55_02740 [Methanoregulaceae archaeon]|nr:hypothetical protein [Methanoregulaceae archaeon]
MKSRAILRDERSSRPKTECAGRIVSVSSHCAFCGHCQGLEIRGKTTAHPLDAASGRGSSGGSSDEPLFQAVMQFNSLAGEADSVVCDDDEDAGFISRFRR